MDGAHSFIFVKSETTDDRYPRGPSWSKTPPEYSYETGSDEEEWVSRSLKDQIVGTVSSIQEKQVKDKEKIYIVLGVESQFVPNEDKSKIRHITFHQNTLTLIKNLSAEILCYLNKEHTNLLISCRLCDLTHILAKSKYRMKYFKTVKRISPLLPNEQISKHLQKDNEWTTNSKEIVIELIPNIPSDKRNEYTKNIIQYLKGMDRIADGCCDEEFIITKLDEATTKDLLKTTNLIFRITEFPKGILQHANITSTNIRKNKPVTIKGKTSSAQSIKSPTNLPVVCVLDTGVNRIAQLDGLLLPPLDGYRDIPNFNDDYEEHGHGTPIAYLTAFGENNNIPKAKIISYKIFSELNRNVYFDGYRLAFAKYSSEYQPNRSRIFVSSISFDAYDGPITAAIDRWIQENNVCAVFAAGNIDPEIVSSYMRDGIHCSDYIQRHRVQDPAQAVNGLAIGAIAKRAHNSISQVDELSPFSRCGTLNGGLFNCQKPEFVAHGGNQCLDGTPLGITSFDKNGQVFTDFLGTSFAAPLFVNRLADIMACYGHRFRNAETLKAIALALSYGQLSAYKGFGELKSLDRFDYGLEALVCSEGNVPLMDRISDKQWKVGHSGKITITVPNEVNSIKLFLVHSDNHFREALPHLNTYLTVKATKIPHDSANGKVDANNPQENERKSNMKIFEWAFPSHSMGGLWTFSIKPQLTADISDEHERATTIRYGCAILLNSKTTKRKKPLTQELYELNKQRE
jgi:hypothetical protein